MKKSINHIFFGLFIVILLIPAHGMLIDKDWGNKCENRALFDQLNFSFTKQFLEDFDLYVKDNIGYRNSLTNVNASIKFHLFNSSSHPQHSVIGEDDWIFYTDNSDNILNSYSRKNTVSQEELKAKVEQWETFDSTLSSRSIQFLTAVFPNKSTIYEEKVPYNMRALKRDTLSRTDQFVNYLQASNSPVQLLDIREQLLHQKSEVQNYHKFDTHWNEYGAFLAYQELCKAMGIQPYELSDFDIHFVEFSSGDLGRMAGLCNNRSIQEMIPSINKKNPPKYGRADTKENAAICWKNEDPTLQRRLVIFKDSYTDLLMKFLSLHFKEAYFVGWGFNYEAIDRLEPDVVLIANVERYFAR